MNTKKPMSLTSRVILGMVAGILTGFAIRTLFAGNGFVDAYIVNGLFEVGGQIFVTSLKMLVVPLVFVSLVCGTSSLKDLSTLGRMGGKTLAFYVTTTAIAITLALTMGTLFQPGAGADLTAASSFKSAEAPSLGQVIIDMFPTNPISAMAEGKTLQVIVFAVLQGLAAIFPIGAGANAAVLRWATGWEADPALMAVGQVGVLLAVVTFFWRDIFSMVHGLWRTAKGKRDPGETDEECAVREVWEETGLRCALGRELPGAVLRLGLAVRRALEHHGDRRALGHINALPRTHRHVEALLTHGGHVG